jgi:hypothetical protein
MENLKKSISKKESANLSSVKINLKKGNRDLQNVESNSKSSKSIYKGMESLSTDEKKIFRGKLRRKLSKFHSDILGNESYQKSHGRSDDDIINDIKSFISFYKENWMIQDFKIENFSSSRNEIDRKNYQNLLNFIQSTLEK